MDIFYCIQLSSVLALSDGRILFRLMFAMKGILELQGWTDGMDPDSDWVMSALLVSCPQPRLRYVWPDFSWDICFRMFL